MALLDPSNSSGGLVLYLSNLDFQRSGQLLAPENIDRISLTCSVHLETPIDISITHTIVMMVRSTAALVTFEDISERSNKK